MFEPFFDQRGVGVIGASRDPHKLGYGVVRNLMEYRYRGSIYPVNPVATEILGHTCYPSITDVPDPVDLAVVVVPAQIVADVMGQTRHVHGRHGRLGERARGEIGYHALRVGDNPGEHTVVFGLLGETIELTVRSTNRDCYAQGALAAAKFIVRQSPGLYGMNDVLEL